MNQENGVFGPRFFVPGARVPIASLLPHPSGKQAQQKK
jgi:hypothetical protein